MEPVSKVGDRARQAYQTRIYSNGLSRICQLDAPGLYDGARRIDFKAVKMDDYDDIPWDFFDDMPDDLKEKFDGLSEEQKRKIVKGRMEKQCDLIYLFERYGRGFVNPIVSDPLYEINKEYGEWLLERVEEQHYIDYLDGRYGQEFVKFFLSDPLYEIRKKIDKFFSWIVDKKYKHYYKDRCYGYLGGGFADLIVTKPLDEIKKEFDAWFDERTKRLLSESPVIKELYELRDSLTPRQLTVFELIGKGLSNQDILLVLERDSKKNMSIRTVESHIRDINRIFFYGNPPNNRRTRDWIIEIYRLLA